MRKLFILFTLFSLQTSLTTKGADHQIEKGRDQVGFTFSTLGNIDLLSSANTVGGPGYRGDGFKSFGVTYIYRINKTFDFETGIEYSNYKIIIEPNLPLIYHGTASLAKFSLIDIPATFRINFLRYLFLNGGVFLDITGANSGSVDDPKGLGVNLGLGLKYRFKNGVSLFINPYSKAHSLLSSSQGQQRLIESGFRFGVQVNLNKLDLR